MCKISIIIPVYNAQNYIKQCLDSIINQTLEDIEIIIINDGSDDDSVNICKGYEYIDSRFRVINKLNEGVSTARNIGIEQSMGKYIMFVDADDCIEKNTCEILYKSIEETHGDMVFCNHIIEFDNENKLIKNDFKSNIIKDNEIKNTIMLGLIDEDKEKSDGYRATFRSPWGKLFLKSIIKNNNIKFDNNISIGEDFLFNLNYLNYCRKVIMVDDYLYHYKVNSTSVINKYKYNCWDIYKSTLLKLEEFFNDNFKEKDYIDKFNKLKMKFFFISINNELKNENKKSIKQKKIYIKSLCKDEIILGMLRLDKKITNKKSERIKLFLLKKGWINLFLFGSYIKK